MPDLKKTIESKFISNYHGRMEYSAGLSLQADLLQKVQTTHDHHVIGLEHPAVITLGYRARPENEVHAENRISIEKISRGGFATLHSEGQLVIYPVLNLRNLNLGVRDYIYLLLETTMLVLQGYGIKSFIKDEALGLYTNKGKITFCGIQISRGITQHGISINVSNDLGLFRNIRSCGADTASFDRVADHAENAELTQIYAQWIIEFRKKLGL